MGRAVEVIMGLLEGTAKNPQYLATVIAEELKAEGLLCAEEEEPVHVLEMDRLKKRKGVWW